MVAKSRVTGRIRAGTAVLTALIAIGVAVAPAMARRHRRAFQAAQASTDTSQWTDVIQALGNTPGTVTNGVLTVHLPRTDLQNVSIGGVALQPDFAADGIVSFRRISVGTEVKFELALLDNEVSSVVGAFVTGGASSAGGAFVGRDPESITAIHNHYVKDAPPLKFVHGFAVGNGAAIAGALHDALAAHSATPFGGALPSPADPGFDTGQVTATLGGTSELNGNVLEVMVERREAIHQRGWYVPAEMQVSSTFEFQSIGNGQVAVIAEFVLRSNEVNRVLRSVQSNGIAVSAIHNHELNVSPNLYYLHAFATGDPSTIARNLRTALNMTNSHFE
jgi:uncharacterized protein DUF1259